MKVTNKSIWAIIFSICIFTVLASLPFSKANNEDNNTLSNTAPEKHTDLSEEENEDIKKFRQEFPELWKPRMSHGTASEGLAAFLICERKQFKLDEPISVMLGIMYEGVGMNMTFQQPYGPCQPDAFSWFSITGPDGKDVPYTGMFISFAHGPGPERAIRLTEGQFRGIQWNLRWSYELDTPGSYTIKWHYRIPPIFGGSWWQGHLVSNEIQIEIVE